MFLDRLVKTLLPREDAFYSLLEQGADCAARAALLLVECCSVPDYDTRVKLIDRMHEAEHDADRVIHEVNERLNRTFITPIDRSDIYNLANELENVVDAIFGTAQQIIVHSMEELPAGSRELAVLVKESCDDILHAVKLVRQLKYFTEIHERCVSISKNEAKADAIFRVQIGHLFKTEKDAIKLLKHKEFLEGLEHTLDICDDVGNALDSIIIKNA